MPKPDDENRRLAALETYHILDTPPEKPFDDLARLAAYICGAPTALVTFIDHDRQWFKAAHGFGLRETSRETAFCNHTIKTPDLFVVKDATKDPRFATNPLVTNPPGIRFYAGSPLRTPDGHGLGALCVLDTAPRVLSTEQADALGALARQAILLLELRRRLREADAGAAASWDAIVKALPRTPASATMSGVSQEPKGGRRG